MFIISYFIDSCSLINHLLYTLLWWMMTLMLILSKLSYVSFMTRVRPSAGLCSDHDDQNVYRSLRVSVNDFYLDVTIILI